MLFCRIYDKQKELGIDIPVTRLEYEIKGVLASLFSAHYSNFGFEDAINYLYENLSAFNNRKGLDTFCPSFEFGFYENNVVVDEKVKREKLRRFLKQYHHTITNYVNWLGQDTFFKLCTDLSAFDETLNNIQDMEKDKPKLRQDLANYLDLLRVGGYHEG